MMNPRMRLSVLISGNGSNLQALIDARDAGRLDVEIVNVISNTAAAGGLQRAAAAGIPCSILEHGRYADRNDFDQALAVLMGARSPDLVVLAGFMRILGPRVLDQWEGGLINLHPSLLPRHRGTNTYQRAIDAGDEEHGASIHFVTAELDGGPVISQVRIPVCAGDDANTLAGRLAPMEHRLIVSTVELFTNTTVQCGDGEVLIDGTKLTRPLLLKDDDTLTA
jgi:phosphoribosylglycinamide formyltransferase-1